MQPLELPNLTDTQKTFDAMRNNLLTVNTAVNTLQEDVKDMDRRMDKLEGVVVVGIEGEIPLVEQVRNNTQFIQDFKYWTRVIIALILAQFVAFTTASIVAYLKFLPVLEKLAQKP